MENNSKETPSSAAWLTAEVLNSKGPTIVPAADILQWDFDEGAGPKHPEKMHLPKALPFPSKRTKYPFYLHFIDEAVEVFLGTVPQSIPVIICF